MDNYKADDEILTKIGLDVENAFDLDRARNGKFKFCLCRVCDGPILGHRADKCRHLNGKTYNGTLVTKFDNLPFQVSNLPFQAYISENTSSGHLNICFNILQSIIVLEIFKLLCY